ncbi:HAD family hydrolase [Paraliomyxa miuraensis]|uniref:hypothetical protein n=1 Tax=Paraliomyxa miuraensis TaxID=376150 RepID=UPI002259EEFF|nr:hypothetical protein [Paraliomyxa miuraensis]MCX4239400.1 hypothetical protein [Paraliomyxa miuraensis]
MSVEDGVITVGFDSGRAQRIHLATRDDNYAFTSRILGAQRLDQYSWTQLARIVWLRNRRTPLVTFMLDERGRLVGRVEHPAATLDPDELRTILLHLARECDRLEYLLTGRDEQ